MAFIEIRAQKIIRFLQREYPGYVWKPGDQIQRDEELQHLAVIRNGKLMIYHILPREG